MRGLDDRAAFSTLNNSMKSMTYINAGLVYPNQTIQYKTLCGDEVSTTNYITQVYTLPYGTYWCTVDDELRVNFTKKEAKEFWNA